jgi:N12 class adenine-specific DNA methylase/predicted RNA methylase
LPGFDLEAQAYPDLFNDAPTSAPHLPVGAPAPSSLAVETTRAWRPVEAALSPRTAGFEWPTWDDTILDGIDGQATKFEANLSAIAALRRLASDGDARSAAERGALLRYTGWGGIPASFNLEGRDAAWQTRARRLVDALSADEHESAKASVNNSHYTDPIVIHWIWTMLQRMGFRGGTIVEPSAGIGHFVGCMPAHIAAASRITAVEVDVLSGRILNALYAAYGVDVRIAPFEATAIADDSADLVISNVPFGAYRVSDHRNRPYSRASIHNWFVGRALDIVRPGGMVCFVTSSYFLDENDPSTRAHAASVADLLAAFRLPSGTFERLASTSVQADLVVLRKRQAPGHGDASWLDLGFVPEPLRHPRCSDRYMRVNQWFIDHPEHVLGLIDRVSNGYQPVPTAVLDGELKDALRSALDLVPADILLPTDRSPATLASCGARDRPLAPQGLHRPGSYALHGGRVCVVDGAHLHDVHDLTQATVRHRISGMVNIRDRARALLNAQLHDVPERELADQRRGLNASYDRFIARHGYLSSRANALAFRRDPDYPLLLSLEHYDEEEETAVKADIFFRRTVSRIEEPSRAEDPDQALALSMQWKGRVDPDYMARLLRADAAAVLADLAGRGMVFRNPETDLFETADAYLSGEVKRKLNIALAAGAKFTTNANALEKVIPEDLPPASIEPRLGAVWIPADVIETFMVEVLRLENISVRYLALAGTWSVEFNDWAVRQNVACIQDYGTRRMHAVELLQQALNVQTPTVRDPHPEKDGAYVVNKEETLAVREKLAMLKARFAAWAYEDTPRREKLCRIYNDLFNCLRQREFDGSHLKLPGFSHCFELHESQRNAIWRIVQSGNTGLFHAVGAGKTAIMSAASMELRRLGLANKPVHVVPNHCLEQYTAEFVRLYPGASVLMATKDDLAGDRRREFVSRVATGAWDAVVMTHSTFGLLPMSPAFTSRFIKAIIRELELAVRATSADNRSNRIVKQLERMKKVWKVRLERLENQEKKDDFLSWESLGIDQVFADEGHLFKNLWRHTKMARIAGLPLANSQRAFDLFLKSRYTMDLYRGQQRGLVIATATPVANSMAEIYTFQRYLQPNTLRALGLEQFDAWAGTFGETVTALEIAPDGNGYRLNTRFARFINVPDLMGVFCDVSDIRTREMLKLPVPELKGGKPRTVTCKPSAALKAFVQTLVKRAEKLKTDRVDPRVDNMLRITGEGRKAALDMRLVSSLTTADAEGKVAKCAREVRVIWQRTAGLKRAQLVFCDLSTPKGGKEFSVYEALRGSLMEAGIPPEQIAFIHDAETDAQKGKLFRQVREGRVRILMGSTEKMGIGTNVQKRLVALHELDCPWRPCDVEQREGRILRQGNECDEVEIIRYVTEGSFDAYSWQTVLSKARFIEQVMSGDKGLRSAEDVELATLTYAEVKALASGNPKVIEMAGVDAEIARYSSLFSVWRNQRYANQAEVANLPMRIAGLEQLVAALEADAQSSGRVLAVELQATIHSRDCRGREDIGEALRSVIKTARGSIGARSSEEKVGQLGAFGLHVFIGPEFDDVHLYLQGRTSHDCRSCQTGPALVSTLMETLHGIERHKVDVDFRLAQMRTKLADLQGQLASPFEHEDRLAALLVRRRDLSKELDLGSDEVGSGGLDATEEPLAA